MSSQEIDCEATDAVAINTTDRVFKRLNTEVPEIRVLKLLPSPDLEAPIECHLIHRPLHDNSHDYEALTYVWGVPELIRRITLNGKPFLITRNLEMALRYLRLADSDRTLWVDALCINQSDPDERSRQVRLMKFIYAGCQADLAWMLNYQEALEPSTSRYRKSITQSSREEEQDKKIKFDMQLIARAMTMTRQSTTNMRDVEQQDASDIQKSSYMSLEDAAMLAPFFNGTYLWYRVWTMQELSFAPRVILVAGPHQLDWAVVSEFLGDRPIADPYHAPFRHFLRSMEWDRTLGGAQKVESQRRILRDNQYNATLMDVLARFQSNEATDPRDCVYGLLGLVTEEHSISIDYTKSATQVFVDTALAVINKCHDLDILCQTAWMAGALPDNGQPKIVPDLPSWVPDFSRQVGYGDHEKILFAQRGIYKSGWDMRSGHFDNSAVDGRFLPVKAVVLGALVCEVAYPRDRPIYQLVHSTAHEWLETAGIGPAILDEDKKYEPTGEAILGAYWRTLLVDCTCYPITRLTSEDQAVGDRVFRKIFGLGWKDHPFGGSSSGNADDADGLDNSGNADDSDGLEDSDDSQDLVEDKILRKLWWRDSVPKHMRDMWLRNYKTWSFAITDNGLYTMVKHARPGDVIVSVEGAKVPLILRAGQFDQDDRRTYSLIGTAYVHGYMDGEALRDVAQGTRSEEAILLI